MPKATKRVQMVPIKCSQHNPYEKISLHGKVLLGRRKETNEQWPICLCTFNGHSMRNVTSTRENISFGCDSATVHVPPLLSFRIIHLFILYILLIHCYYVRKRFSVISWVRKFALRSEKHLGQSFQKMVHDVSHIVWFFLLHLHAHSILNHISLLYHFAETCKF